jgi:hypothetical protein
MTRNFIRLLKVTSQATLISLALLPMTAAAEGAVQIIWDCGETKPCIKFKDQPGAAGGLRVAIFMAEGHTIPTAANIGN